MTPTGIRLTSGRELDADIIVTATGLQLVTLGEVEFVVDGEPVDFSDTWTYKGFAYSDVPNLASSFGYINASWTLRADLTCEYVCRLLNHMDATGTRQCTPRLRPSDAGMRGAAVDRGLLVGLRAAGAAPVAEAGRSRAVDQPAALQAGQEAVPQGSARRRRDDVHTVNHYNQDGHGDQRPISSRRRGGVG